MDDVAFLAIVIAFFALAGLLVAACERIIGADEQSAPGVVEEPSPVREVAA